jgi:hypothetical protein
LRTLTEQVRYLQKPGRDLAHNDATHERHNILPAALPGQERGEGGGHVAQRSTNLKRTERPLPRYWWHRLSFPGLEIPRALLQSSRAPLAAPQRMRSAAAALISVACGGFLMSQSSSAGRLLLGCLIGYLAITLTESFMHRAVGHPSIGTLRFWKRHPTLCGPFYRAYYAHQVVHHSKTFQRRYTQQFDTAEQQSRLDEELSKLGWYGRLVKEERYGLTLEGFGSIGLFLSPSLPFLGVIYGFLGLSGFLGAIFPYMVYVGFNKCIHPYLHLRSEIASVSTPLRWLLSTNWLQYVACYHYLHHKYPKYNFNIVLGGDFLLHTFKQPAPTDIEEMNKLGLTYPSMSSFVFGINL